MEVKISGELEQRLNRYEVKTILKTKRYTPRLKGNAVRQALKEWLDKDEEA